MFVKILVVQQAQAVWAASGVVTRPKGSANLKHCKSKIYFLILRL